VPARRGGSAGRPVASSRRALMESVDYCPMGSPVLDIFGGNRKQVLASAWSCGTNPPPDRPISHLGSATRSADIVWWTAWRGTQWGQLDRRLYPASVLRGAGCLGLVFGRVTSTVTTRLWSARGSANASRPRRLR
jgi:hypothetical protein